MRSPPTAPASRSGPLLPLRTSLALWAVGLTATALLVAAVASAVALRAYLLDRTDDQLVGAAVLVAERGRALTDDGDGQMLRAVLAPTDYLVEYRRPDGGTTRLSSAVALPARPLLDRAPAPPPGGRSALTTVDAGPEGVFRVVTLDIAGARVLVGLPLEPVRQTVRQLILIEAAVSAAVLLGLAMTARLLVARRLRPLDEIAATATAIAAGDLNRRVPVAAPPARAARTEVGRLSVAVNGMLARIQSALAARARSEERMRVFVADASHELRTPLTSIRGYTQLLRTGVVDPQRRPDVLRRVDDEATRMAAIVDGLLYLARLDAEPRLRREPVDLAVVVRDSVADALAAEPLRTITLDSPAHHLVIGDEDALRQVLANLMANVRAHTPVDAPARVELVVGDAEVTVTVTDTGPGIAVEDTARIFDRFHRVAPGAGTADGSGSGGSGPGGSGLGLAIVAAAVAAHGGQVGVRAGPGTGVAVWFTLPAVGGS
jgi:two-component system OmpR family sensor kinase